MSTDSLENAPTEPVKRKRGRPPGSVSHTDHIQRVLTSREALEAAVRALASVVGLEETFKPITLVMMTDQQLENAIRELAHAKFGVTAAAKSDVPSVDEQMNRIVRWQRARSIYFHRSEKEMASLRARLLEMPVGTEAIPAYANSVQVREPSGRVYLMNYSGYEVVQ